MSLINRSLKYINLRKAIEKKILTNKINKNPKKPPKYFSKFIVEEFKVQDRSVWSIKPHVKPQKTALFLHGGAFYFNITGGHWDFISMLVQELSIEIYVPDYPLAPESTYTETYQFLDELYSTIMDKNETGDVCFMGDSAGGTLALGFSQVLDIKKHPLPKKIFLFSPWLDLTLSNSEIKNFEENDYILSVNGLLAAALNFSGGSDLFNPLLSPIYGKLDVSKLYIFSGQNDILYPDVIKLVGILNKRNIEHKFYDYPQMFHDWIVIKTLPETRDVIERIKKTID
jgi:epsilon-lactone hydrolase